MTLVVVEHQAGIISRASWEAVAAVQSLAPDGPVALLVVGAGVADVATSAAARGVGPVYVVDDAAVGTYTPDAHVFAVQAAVAALRPGLVAMAHSYQARDYAPALAARLDSALVSDVVGVRLQDGELRFRRPMFQGKLAAEVRAVGAAPTFVAFQIGAFRADAVVSRTGGAPSAVERLTVDFSGVTNRQRAEAPFREARQAVDLSQAERVVAVGRGIKSQEHIAVAQRLADALGAELAASRPICDNGWLAMDRQVGSSGQTVAPKLYVAVGISGAIQHLVGMKGSKTIVAINKDPDAPIFEVADYGVVGDLFEVLPALTNELNKRSR
ncbi:MAG TPA: electron transfer flavoprotein subunit alpha/FixB family protein [Vicinamibacterales bacterium]